MKKAYADIDEGQIHYRYAGQGNDNIIFLHMSGSSSDEYEKVGDLLAQKNYKVFAVDLLAFGGSDNPPRFYSLEDHAKTIVEFMDAVGIDRAYLYGNMATANMAVHIEAAYTHRVKGLMLANPLYNPDPLFYVQKRNWASFEVIETKEDGSHLLEMWLRSAKYGTSAAISDERCRCLYNSGEWGETLHWALFEDKPIGEYLTGIKVPTVVIAYSSLGDPALLKEAAEMIPEGKYDIFENGNPYISRYEPERVVDMFIKHFNEVEKISDSEM
ncbi:MAG: alpha/beta hydrolase [Eubacteriales bacterium]|nr:alpha/beta hydrolase [Eubacteriales bacterium]